jgi:nitrogenase-associated protein
LARVTFYEKPRCGTNARQKRMLEAAGHEIVTKNLLTESWTAERLRGFFGAMPIASWFNSAAPRVKSGEIDPMNVAAPAALALMLAEPLLIRRPLLEVEAQRCAGFEDALVTLLLGGGNVNPDVLGCGPARISAPCPASDDAGRRIQQ